MNFKFPVIKHPYKLIFYRQTVVKPCDDFAGPLYGFRFVEFDDIINRKVGAEATVDLIGYVVSTTDMDVFNRSGKESKRVSFEFVNQKSESLSVTLWDDYAQQFSTFLSGNSSVDPVIVLIQFGKVKLWKGNPNIQNAFFGSRVLINEDVEEMHSFRKSLILSAAGEGSSQLSAGPLSSATVYTSREEFLHKNVRKYVEEICEVTTESVCVLLGTIKSVEDVNSWFYVACYKCNKKVVPVTEIVSLEDIDVAEKDDDVGVLYCPKCKIRSPQTAPRYKVQVRVQDTTGTISVVIFDKEVLKLIGRSAHDIRDQVKDGEENALPRELIQLVGKRFIFKIEISSYNLTSNYTVYTALKVCDDKDIISQMIENESNDQDVHDVKDADVGNSEEESPGVVSVKAVSYTEDSEVVIDVENNVETCPKLKHVLILGDDECDDENGQASSTKRKLLPVKVEKP